jgi:putative transposase
MHEWQCLAHVRWECKYHVVFIPKYRRKVLYGKRRRRIGAILRDLCVQKVSNCWMGTPYWITCTRS